MRFNPSAEVMPRPISDPTARRRVGWAVGCAVLAGLIGVPTCAVLARTPKSPKTSTATRHAKPTIPTKHSAQPLIPAAPVSAAALLGWFRKSPGFSAAFVESKRMALLAAPLRSEGRLFFTAPGRLARHIDKPTKSVVLIEPNRVRMFDSGAWQTIDLKTHPMVRRFVGSFVSLLRGDEVQLRKLYRISYSRLPRGVTPPTPQPKPCWRVGLVPKVAPLNKVVKRLTLEGCALTVQRMRMVELDGDQTLTQFTHVNAARHFSRAELARLFYLPNK